MKKATITFLFAAALMAVFSCAVLAQTTTPRAKEMEYKRDDTERLNLLSEVVSFSTVIDRVPPLRWFDRLGSVRPD